MDRDTAVVLTVNLSVAASIVAYSKLRCVVPGFEDPLLRNFLGGDISVGDGWSCSHFLFNVIQGFLFPRKVFLIASLGLVWEGLEYATSHTDVGFLDRVRGVSTCKHSDDYEGDHYWYAKWTDLAMNAGGLATGYLIATKLRPRSREPHE